MQDTITIPMEEYKELLQIKGKYEELKRMSSNVMNPIILDNPLISKDNVPFRKETWINTTSGGILKC